MAEQSFSSSFIFCSPNLITESGQVSVIDLVTGSNTAYSNESLLKIIDRNPFSVLTVTSGGGNDLILRVSLTAETVNFICIKNCNLKDFSFFINSALLHPTYGETSTAEWSSSSESNIIVKFNTITASSFEIVCETSFNNNNVFEIGEVFLGNGVFELPRNPAASNYTPQSSGVREEIKTADGGIATYQIAEKFKTDLKLKYIDHSTQTDLHNLWKTSTAYEFIPFPTCTGWKGESYEVNWVGAFDFYENAYNDRNNPLYNGVIRLRETPL